MSLAIGACLSSLVLMISEIKFGALIDRLPSDTHFLATGSSIVDPFLTPIRSLRRCQSCRWQDEAATLRGRNKRPDVLSVFCEGAAAVSGTVTMDTLSDIRPSSHWQITPRVKLGRSRRNMVYTLQTAQNPWVFASLAREDASGTLFVSSLHSDRLTDRRSSVCLRRCARPFCRAQRNIAGTTLRTVALHGRSTCRACWSTRSLVRSKERRGFFWKRHFSRSRRVSICYRTALAETPVAIIPLCDVTKCKLLRNSSTGFGLTTHRLTVVWDRGLVSRSVTE